MKRVSPWKKRSHDLKIAAPPERLIQEEAENQASDPTPHKQVLERLKAVLAELGGWSMPIGEEGRAFLDALELTDQIREKARERAKEMLLKEPGIIPGWTAAQGGPVRELDKDTCKVFQALHEADDEVTLPRFLESCSISLGAIGKLLKRFNPALSDTQVESQLGRVLEPLIHYRKGSVRLSRVKELPPPEPAREITL
jgi:hypothetical protein